MTFQTVPTSSIIGMTFSLLIALGVPIALLILIRVKLKTKIYPFFIGCATFFVFALVLEQILHTIVFAATGTLLQNNILFYALYGGLAAALFEETGRFISMKLFMKKCLTRENALMYGAGHGGFEAIMLVGVTYIFNLLYAFMINSGALEASLSVLDSALQEQTITALAPLWLTPSSQFFIGGIERVIAMMLHICLSVLVYKAVSGKKQFFLLAFGIHFLVDFAVVLAANYLPLALVELVLLAMVAVVVFFTRKVYREDAA